MGRKVLVSILGRGREEKDGTGYSRAKYCFEDGYEQESTFFTHSLWKWLKNDLREPDALVLLGTTGSMWDALWEVLPDAVKASEEVSSWKTSLHEICVGEQTTMKDLDVRKEPFSFLPFASYLKMDIIPDCRNSEDIKSFCRILLSHLEPGDEVILDVTHGYRHLPVLASFLVTSLRWLLNVTVHDVFYGAWEMKKASPDGIPSVPVVNLGYAATLFEQGAAYATFEITGRYGALAQFFPKQNEKILLTDYYENIGQIHAAQPHAQKLYQNFSQMEETIDDAWLTAAARKLTQEWKWSHSIELHQRMLALAENLFRRDEFYKSIIMLQEAFYLYTQKKVYGAYQAGKTEEETKQIKAKTKVWTIKYLTKAERQQLNQLRWLRNGLAHSQQSPNRSIQRIMENRSQMISFLKGIFELIHRYFDNK
ncbi:MAG: TIGR02221 family CRISPR-associated protein [Candidatus Hydrogenedens sp.]|jgi:CRISPR-associated Csx2 family protein|nr:TIGR02221 family CRISPR-associated protein [Candidatus Hydrogenedens sp.]